MNCYSDTESHDSDDGIRYKTVSTRYKAEDLSTRNRSRSRSPQTREIVGPQLPPHLRKKDSDNVTRKEETTSSYIGPQLPPQMTKPTNDSDSSSAIGPQLPPHLQKKEEPEDYSSYGPQLPPQLQKPSASEVKCIGPQIPLHLRKKLQAENPPPEESEESDEDTYGPLPATFSIASKSQLALEERALQLKMDQLEPDSEKPQVREEWMLALPEVKAAKFGLGPRQFRAKAGPDMSDRSSWTDTPDKKHKDKEEEVDLKKETEMKEIRRRDEEQERISKKLKKKNKESLLDIHQSKMMKEKKDEGLKERRPFSRELDLQVNRFDEAQKKAVLKKAQLLDTRFSSGQSKFL